MDIFFAAIFIAMGYTALYAVQKEYITGRFYFGYIIASLLVFVFNISIF